MTAAVQTAPMVDTRTTDIPPSPEGVSPKPTKAKVLDAIVGETGCSRSRAGNVIVWIKGLVARARANEDKLVRPTDRELRSPNYEVLDVIMPHGQTSKPGSAHALVEALVLNPSSDETGLVHDMTSDEPSSPYYCSVGICLGVI